MLLYTVRCSPSILARQTIFFNEKVLCVRREDCYPDANPAYGVRRKTCSRNMANAFYRLFAVRRFFVVSPLFCCCLRIVYSELYNRLTLGQRRRPLAFKYATFRFSIKTHRIPANLIPKYLTAAVRIAVQLLKLSSSSLVPAPVRHVSITVLAWICLYAVSSIYVEIHVPVHVHLAIRINKYLLASMFSFLAHCASQMFSP